MNDNDAQSYLFALSAESGNEIRRIPRDEGTNLGSQRPEEAAGPADAAVPVARKSVGIRAPGGSLTRGRGANLHTGACCGASQA